MKTKSRMIVIGLLTWLILLTPMSEVRSQVVIAGIIKSAIKRVIKAVDLRIQRLQTRTIWLQNAQRTLENAMSKLYLEDISKWTQKQKEQYSKYYKQLATVRSAILYHRHLREIASGQQQLVSEYRTAWDLLIKGGEFNVEESEHMGRVYAGILKRGLDNLASLDPLMKIGGTRMTDQQRIEILQRAANESTEVLGDLREFNRQNMMLKIGRKHGVKEIRGVSELYGGKKFRW